MSLFPALRSTLYDILFPPTCVGCGEHEFWLCPECLASITQSRHDFESDVLDGIVTCGSYANPVLRRVITSLKYQAASCLQTSIQNILEKRRAEAHEPWPWVDQTVTAVIAIPSEERRVRERGICHAELIADLVKKTIIPWADRKNILKRTGRSLPNATLPPDALRRANTLGKFRATQPVDGSVILVDDVLTTGATAEESARVLKSAGAKNVFLFTLAHGG